jgi:hypothetical protein
MVNAHSLADLTKWLRRGKWRNAFNQLMDRQLGPQLLELVSLNRRFGCAAFPTI